VGDTATISIVTGFQLLSNPYPVESTVTELGFSAAYDDKIYLYTPGAGYQIATYTKGFFGLPDGWDNNFTIPVGAGFWYSSQADTDWVADRPFDVN